MTSTKTTKIVEQSEYVIDMCVRRGLSVIGETGGAAAMYMLRTRNRGVKLTDARPLSTGLREIFGLGSAVLLRAIRDELRAVNTGIAEVQSSVNKAASEIEEALYGVEHGLR